MISFDFPYLLLLIPIIFFIWYLLFREKIGYKVSNLWLRKYISTPKSLFLLWILRFIIISISVGILAGPSISMLKKISLQPESHILIILDISRSMLADDIKPDRISGAKDTIHTFLTKRKVENIGILLFAGKPFLSVPFSHDYLGIQNVIKNISPYTIRQELPGLSGTAIGDALLLGISTFSGITAEHKNILLFTDGRVNIGINPRKVITDLNNENIHVYTIGIGTLSGGNIPGNIVLESTGGTTLDESLLIELAEKTGGKYFHVTESMELTNSLEDIDTLMQNSPHDEIREIRVDYRLQLTLLLGFLLFIEYLLSRYIFGKYNLL